MCKNVFQRVNATMNWEFHTFQSLDTQRLFELMKLRTDVFVVEQQCAYPELDHFDNLPSTIHLLGFDEEQLSSYARAMPMSEVEGDDASPLSSIRIGRVVVIKPHRGTGLAEQLMKRMMNRLEESYPATDQILSAQEPIVAFYEALGFVAESESYLEDGIPHVDMRRSMGSA